MTDQRAFEQFLQTLATARSPAEQAALIAESAFDQQPAEIALVARRCIILRWFDETILAALMPETATHSASEVAAAVANLPFVERLPWGLTYHDQTRSGLLARYAVEQPELLQQAAALAAPAYQNHVDPKLAGPEALFCLIVAGQLAEARQQLDRLIGELAGSEDSNGLLALFTTCDQAALLPVGAPLPLTAFHHFVHGFVFQQLGKPEEATAAYQQAIALDEKYASPWNNLGNVYYDQKRYEEAIAAYQQAIALDEKYAYPWNGLGAVYYDQKRYEEAIAACQQAIALDEKFASPWNGLGDVYCDQKRYDEAVVAFQQAITLDEKNAYAYGRLATTFRFLGRWTEAETAVRQSLALNPNHQLNRHVLADILRRRGDEQGWQAALAQAQPLIDYSDLYNAACFESVAGNVDRALDLLAQAKAAGRLNPAWAKEDPDLHWVRHDPRFWALMGET